MSNENLKNPTPRRGFLGALAAGTAAFGLSALAAPLKLSAAPPAPSPDAHPADKWFDKVKGTHRVVFDSPHPNEMMPFAWPRIFLLTNEATGSPEKDCGVVVVLRHSSICYAFEDRLWDAYKFGEVFKANDPKTKTTSTRNPFWKPAAGDFKIPGVGEVKIGINELQESGVLFCVCEAAINVHTAIQADLLKKDVEEVKKDWLAGLLPGIQLVPSGVWALGRAQEHGCKYIFAG